MPLDARPYSRSQEAGPSSDQRTDVEFAAQLHALELPDSFFASLGLGFLRAYYRMLTASPLAVLLVERTDGVPAGFVVGTTHDGRHYRWLTRSYLWRMLPVALVALVRHPAVMLRFVRTRLPRYLRGVVRLARRNAPVGVPELQTATLLHLAVAPPFRGSGIGQRLVGEFVAIAAHAGAVTVKTSTRSGSAGAAGFYRSLGWQYTGSTVDVDGRDFDLFEQTP